ncbi:tyrosine-type recombinase/integrase [Streptosporangium algeriense]|uniref:Tyrosine-type recombinase/integrase n=1 Tax=Streptosporangium algeriense TaxID=1682748 RepID=A0ABW3DLA8_9ACTN
MTRKEGVIKKRCGCRDPETGKQLGDRCPKLRLLLKNRKGEPKVGKDGEPLWQWNPDHGTWWARYSAPPGPDGRRRQPWLGPCDTEDEATKALRKALVQLDEGASVPDQKLTFGAYLDQWIKGKKSLKPSTLESYVETIELYGKPGLGHLKLVEVNETHLDHLYTAIGQINNLPEGECPSEMLRRLLAARSLAPKIHLKEGERVGLKRQKPLSASRIHRIHRVLSSALGTAVKTKKINRNPAEHVELPRVPRRRPLVWTSERVARWKKTGKIPGKVMVWTPEQCGHFLDIAEERGERLYSLYHLTATRGLRRGEVCGVRWEDSDLDEAGTLSLLESEEEDDDGLKSDASQRAVTLDDTNIRLLKTWRATQRRERMAAGADWTDTGLIYTAENGSALREEYVSERFAAIVKAAELPPIRFHDLRHCAASMMLVAGVDMKVVSATLGHARYSFTADTYTSVVPQVARAAAEATTAIIPRKKAQ